MWRANGGAPEGVDGGGDEQQYQDIGFGETAVAGEHVGSQERAGCEDTGAGAKAFSREQIDDGERQPCAKGERQSAGPCTYAEDLEGACRQPIGEGRLLQAQ